MKQKMEEQRDRISGKVNAQKIPIKKQPEKEINRNNQSIIRNIQKNKLIIDTANKDLADNDSIQITSFAKIEEDHRIALRRSADNKKCNSRKKRQELSSSIYKKCLKHTYKVTITF